MGGGRTRCSCLTIESLHAVLHTLLLSLVPYCGVTRPHGPPPPTPDKAALARTLLPYNSSGSWVSNYNTGSHYDTMPIVQSFKEWLGMPAVAQRGETKRDLKSQPTSLPPSIEADGALATILHSALNSHTALPTAKSNSTYRHKNITVCANMFHLDKHIW